MRLTLAVVSILWLTPVRVSSQDVTEPALKAAFIYNFALFTRWPTGRIPAAAPFVLCVLGDQAVHEALEVQVKGRLLDGHLMAVIHLENAAPPPTCHILYLSGLPLGKAGQFVSTLLDMPVLTISDVEGFTTQGGVAQFFFEHGQLRFRVATTSAKRAGLEISSKLLRLAGRR